MAKSADAFRTISEVAEWLETPAHVLRFWESKFSQVKPVKRAGGRRYYRPADMQLLGGIKKLLHEDGMTIKGVQKMLREHGVKHVAALSQPLDEVTELEASGFAADLPEATDSQATGTVLNFQDGAQAPPAHGPAATEPPEPSIPPDKTPPPTTAPAPATPVADPPQEPEPATPEPAQPELADSPPAPDAPAEPPRQPEPEPASEPAPVMPSFARHHADAAQPPAAQTPPPAPAPVTIDLPDDPADDTPASPGALSALAGCRRPVSPSLADALNQIAKRLSAAGPERGA